MAEDIKDWSREMRRSDISDLAREITELHREDQIAIFEAVADMQLMRQKHRERLGLDDLSDDPLLSDDLRAIVENMNDVDDLTAAIVARCKVQI